MPAFSRRENVGRRDVGGRYEQTLARIELIKRAGDHVKFQWECKFDEAKIAEQKPELLVHPIVKHAPLITRDALYGGRTEAMRLHYKIREVKESVQYCDVMSFKFPIGHRIIHVGDVCADKESCLNMDGLIKYTIVPPKDINHPVLPFRHNKKLLFCLCRSCLTAEHDWRMSACQ